MDGNNLDARASVVSRPRDGRPGVPGTIPRLVRRLQDFPLFAPSWQQYLVAFANAVTLTLLNLWLQNWIGYQAIALVYLLSIVLLALIISRGPILLGTLLTAAAWNFFFAPPPFAFNMSDFYDNMMLVTYFVVTLTVGHLTGHLRTQRDTELRNRLLAESERLGRSLLNSVSHELRTPIAGIQSASSSLRSCAGVPPEARTLAAEIETASLRLNRVVQSLLSAARLQSGQLRANLEWHDVADVVRSAARDAGPFLDGHPFEIRIDPDLPLARVDHVLLQQALSNLIVNAAVHTPPGTPITVSARVEPPHLLIDVADRGPGIPADQVQRLFEPFCRLPQSAPGGTGLGLAIARGFLEAQGGSIHAGPRPGGGAVFSLRLKLTPMTRVPEE